RGGGGGGVAGLEASPYLDESAPGCLVARGYAPQPGFDGLHRLTGRLAIGATDDELLAGPARAKLRTELRRAARHGAVADADDSAGPALLARLSGRPAAWGRAVAALVARGAGTVVVG